ncbi:MAG: SDR family NAD(P)-dependent oxidoreductase [Sphingobacteriia bacterium]|nr:SDR family NAD(P)-dependent oxidoreductase [Sphingobacteriia bacterium]
MSHILITGASSGIGKALAYAYADPSNHLYLIGRNEERLKEVSEECAKKGANVNYKVINVIDFTLLNDFIKSLPQIDIVFANAGISAGTSKGRESYKQIKEIFDINLYGVINTITPAYELMLNKGTKGHVVIISSIAGINPLPSCPAYSSSKAAIRYYGIALGMELKKYNINVTVVNPGFIITPMTEVNNFHMPFLLSAEQAAKIIKKKLSSKPLQINFPFIMYAIAAFINYLPLKIKTLILSNLPKK